YAAGFRPESYPGEGAELLRTLQEEYSLAWESARPGAERAMVEVERAIFSDDWRGLAGRLDQALSGDQCMEGNWIHQVGTTFGRADRVVSFNRRNLRCDPLSGFSYMVFANALVWDGKPEDALQALDDAEALGVTVPFKRDMRMMALLAA
ncbi:MAG: hypothetical protein GTO62_07895, partial [Planctomycetales bacterium]|nr:hypothetical protein [Planctomycetales bacterium]